MLKPSKGFLQQIRRTAAFAPCEFSAHKPCHSPANHIHCPEQTATTDEPTVCNTSPELPLPILTVQPCSPSTSQPGTVFTASFIRLFLQMYTDDFSGTPLRNFCMVGTCSHKAIADTLRQTRVPARCCSLHVCIASKAPQSLHTASTMSRLHVCLQERNSGAAQLPANTATASARLKLLTGSPP